MRAARTSWGSGSPRRSRSTHHHEKQQGGGQQPPSPLLFLWHGKSFPKTFSQHASPRATQAPPQHLSPAAHSNFLPCSFLHCVDSERHGVSSLTGYHALLGPNGLQHLLPGAAHALPQHSPPPWHGKLSPFTFLQQRSPFAEQAPPQHESPPAQLKFAPCEFLQCTGGKRRRVSDPAEALIIPVLPLECALGGLGDRVPPGLGDPRRPTALAPGRGTRVAAALAATLAREAVPIHVLAAEIALCRAGATTALVSSGAIEIRPLSVLAVHGGQATSSVGGQGQLVVQADVLAQCQERVLFAVTLTHRALRITLRDHEESKRNDRCECHFECHLDTHTRIILREFKNGLSQ